jgi:hypothetical protein
MPAELPPSNDPLRTQRARQKTSVLLACTLLLLSAVALLALPLNKVPFPIRALVAAGDVVIAAVLWLIARQKLSGK